MEPSKPSPVTWGCCALTQSPQRSVPPDREVVGRLSASPASKEGQEDMEARVPVPPAAVPRRPCPVPREHRQHRAGGLASRHETVQAVLAARWHKGGSGCDLGTAFSLKHPLVKFP